MTVTDIIAIVMSVGGLVSVLSLLHTKFVTPVKKVIKQVETNADDIKKLHGKVEGVKEDKATDDVFSVEVRAVLFESLVAILDGLEQNGANHIVTEQKNKLIKFMSKQIGSKKR